MQRVQFTKLGHSPLLLKWVYHLQSKYYYVTPSGLFQDKVKKFVIIDAESVETEVLKLFLSQNESNNIYYLVLSSDKVYTDLGLNLEPRPVSKMLEDWPTVIPSSYDPLSAEIIKILFVESLVNASGKPVSILRPFGIIDKDFYPEDIHCLVNFNRLPGCGNTVRSYLLYEEFEYVATELVSRLLSNKTGLYNIGNTDTVTYKHLVDNIAGFTKLNSAVEYFMPVKYVDFWKIPDITRIGATLRWQPKNTIRKTLWRVFSE